MKKSKHFILLCVAFIATACSDPVPKPMGYYRLDLPQHEYTLFADKDYPYSFLLSKSAQVLARTEDGEHYWIDISYPSLNATIHCSYKSVNHNFINLTDDAQRFVYKHAGQADAIEEYGYEDEQNHVYGVFYDLEGNTASPYQFFVTDTTKHFLRGALYFNCIPNQDSLAPVIDYMKTDMQCLMESFRWK